jgi:hypothetical protein
MPRKSKTAMEEGFIRSYWAELAALEDEYGYVVVLSAVPTTQRGVFSWQLSATRVLCAEDGSVPQHRVTQRFPNPSSQTLAGFLWSMSLRLGQMVGEAEDASRAPSEIKG